MPKNPPGSVPRTRGPGHSTPPHAAVAAFAPTCTYCRRYRYNNLTPLRLATNAVLEDNRQFAGTALPNPGTQYAANDVDDAFSTLIQWLYSRMDAVKEGPPGAGGGTGGQGAAAAR